MLTRAENNMFTRVGPGTPAGELLRRYWLPVGVASELTADNPTQTVRILGETLVLFRDKSGNVGLLNDRCSASRRVARPMAGSKPAASACPYHGWLYDTKGNCLETPAEPCESKFHLTVKQKAYPVQKLVGLVLGLSRPAAGAADRQFRCLVSQGRPSQTLYSTAAGLQLVPAHGKFHGPGASADSAPGHRQPRPSNSRSARADSPTMSPSSTSMKCLTV